MTNQANPKHSASAKTPRQKKMGRPLGMPNKSTLKLQRAVDATGLSPLEYMLKVMRDTKADRGRRDEMARAAAPYIHPKLATLQSNVSLSGKLTLESLVQKSIDDAAKAAAGVENKDGEPE